MSFFYSEDKGLFTFYREQYQLEDQLKNQSLIEDNRTSDKKCGKLSQNNLNGNLSNRSLGKIRKEKSQKKMKDQVKDSFNNGKIKRKGKDNKIMKISLIAIKKINEKSFCQDNTKQVLINQKHSSIIQQNKISKHKFGESKSGLLPYLNKNLTDHSKHQQSSLTIKKNNSYILDNYHQNNILFNLENILPVKNSKVSKHSQIKQLKINKYQIPNRQQISKKLIKKPYQVFISKLFASRLSPKQLKKSTSLKKLNLNQCFKRPQFQIKQNVYKQLSYHSNFYNNLWKEYQTNKVSIKQRTINFLKELKNQKCINE